ncbi:MAG: putative inorganic carbon transporter subunit DabA, partial [Planctomycetaceae bacterium]
MEWLRSAVERAAPFLPPQGPIGTFVALNPLAGFEDRPFEEAVLSAARLHAAEPFLPEMSFREALARGRIR